MLGGRLVKSLTPDGFWVSGAELKFHEYPETECDEFVVGDLPDRGVCSR
jgi:GDP-D-mannose 3', 5'-epimerase